MILTFAHVVPAHVGDCVLLLLLREANRGLHLEACQPYSTRRLLTNAEALPYHLGSPDL